MIIIQYSCIHVFSLDLRENIFVYLRRFNPYITIYGLDDNDYIYCSMRILGLALFTEECREYGDKEIKILDEFYSNEIDGFPPLIIKNSLADEWFYTKIKLLMHVQQNLGGQFQNIEWKKFFEKEKDFSTKFHNIYKIICISLTAYGNLRESFKRKIIENLTLEDLNDLNHIHNNFSIAINSPDNVNDFNWKKLYEYFSQHNDSLSLPN